MEILKYNNFNETSINKMKLDLYPILSEKLLDDFEVIVYTEKFIKYFEKVDNTINKFNFSNKIYDCEFVLEFNKNNVPLIILNKINFKNYSKTKKITNQVKRSDYNLFKEIFDINYEFKVILYPYQIVEISKTDNYIEHEDFYPKQQLYLKEIDLVDSGFSSLLHDIIAGVFIKDVINIHIDFDENIIYIEQDSYPFEFDGEMLNITNYVNMSIKLGTYPNTIQLGVDVYEIVYPTSIDVFEYFMPYETELIEDLD
jgi:hypothetical protein